jgi:phosphate transport system substrate-binding protein
MVDEPPPAADDPETAFEQQAARAGLVLPKRRPSDLAGAVAIAVAIVVIAAGVGEVTGWLNLRSAPASGGFKYQTCSGFPVRLSGAVASDLDPSYATWLESSSSELSQSVGGCVELSVATPPASQVGTVLSNSSLQFVATYVGPDASDGVSTGSDLAVVPIALSAVAVVYHLPGVDAPVNLSGPVLAAIFQGTVTSWNDPSVVALNPGVDLSGQPPIQVRYVGEATATNEVMTEFLATSSSSWNASVGAGATVAWPTGSPVDSDAQMIASVAATPGAIGYIDLLGNAPSGVDVAQVEDAASEFVAPDAISTWLAAESFAGSSLVTHAQWTGFSLLGATAAGSYPISMLAYVGLYRDLGTAYSGALSLVNATWILEYVYWLTSGSALAPLPGAFSAAAVGQLNNETYDGTPIVPSDNETGESGGETGEF